MVIWPLQAGHFASDSTRVEVNEDKVPFSSVVTPTIPVYVSTKPSFVVFQLIVNEVHSGHCVSKNEFTTTESTMVSCRVGL